ncbi:uncharacterized protein [Coffea arabica]|uniref:C2 domain-containing protein n=1 Tax=Coffea arabica TaxID=13443 RepID=A0A6P6UBF9_COFAR|nr:uncharacterized protein LOC113709297 [Coffea arabica]
MSPLPFQLLELNVISAQDLAPVSQNLRTYAVAWMNPERKLRTRVDQQGKINPTWNDKFVFRVDEKFLDSETSSVMIEVYAIGWLRDTPVGSVRVLVSNLIPQNVRKTNNSQRRFVALQIRRPSGRPQGILNMGVTLLDNNMKSMPLYSELSASAVGFQDLMGVKKYKQRKNEKNGNDNSDQKEEKIKLRRTQSDCTEVKEKGNKWKGNGEGSVYNSSVVDGPTRGGSSLNGPNLNGSEIGVAKNGSMCNSDVGPSPSVVAAAVARGLYPTPLPKPHDPGSSILGDWTADDASAEGLKSKIDRWKMELPGKCDKTPNSYQKIPKEKERRQHWRRRKSANEGSGRFSCFGAACGCEFTIVCGANNGGRRSRSRLRSSSKHLANSELDSQLVSQHGIQ